MTIAMLAAVTAQVDPDGPTSAVEAAPRRLDGLDGEQGDEQIRARLAVQDRRGALSLCARRFGVSLGRLCFAMLASQPEADEAAQETLLAAYDGALGFRGEGTVKSWLFGIARRICARRLEVRTRQQRRTRLLVPVAQDAWNDGGGSDMQLEAARRGKALRDALGELRPTEREAVLLRFEGDLSFRDVGVACGIDEAAARKRVSRALSRLRERLGSE